MALMDLACWCDNKELKKFSEEYLLCDSCNTLIVDKINLPTDNIPFDDETDLYGKNYWLDHQSSDLELPNIYHRSRSDLSDRCIYWLKTLLSFKLPPASVLEIGSSHGGFVSMLNKVGFDANGLELSPWVVNYSKENFNVNSYLGPIEKQDIPDSSLDIIVMMDVLEHLTSPPETIQKCIKILKNNGFLMIQTPRFPSNYSYNDLISKNVSFQKMLQPGEHIYLFSEQAITILLKRVCGEEIHISFENAIFDYDMFVIVSKSPISKISQGIIDEFLQRCPNSRLIQAMLDLSEQRDIYINLFKQADADRIARLETIEKLSIKYKEIEDLLKYKNEMWGIVDLIKKVFPK